MVFSTLPQYALKIQFQGLGKNTYEVFQAKTASFFVSCLLFLLLLLLLFFFRVDVFNLFSLAPRLAQQSITNIGGGSAPHAYSVQEAAGPESVLRVQAEGLWEVGAILSQSNSSELTWNVLPVLLKAQMSWQAVPFKVTLYATSNWWEAWVQG